MLMSSNFFANLVHFQIFLFGAEDGSSDHVYVMAVNLRKDSQEIIHNIHALKTVERDHIEPVNLVEFVPIHVCYGKHLIHEFVMSLRHLCT